VKREIDNPLESLTGILQDRYYLNNEKEGEEGIKKMKQTLGRDRD